MTFLQQLTRTNRFTLGRPSSFTVSADGRTVLFLRDSSLWAWEDKQERLVAGPGISAYSADDACRTIVFERDGQVHDADGPLPAAAPARAPMLDPSGRRIAYVCAGALRVLDADGDRVLAEPDGPEVTWGLPEYAATASIDRHDGMWWSPGGRRLLAARVDTAPVQRWHVTDLLDPARPSRSFPYPAVGTANADVTLWIIGLDGTAVRVQAGDEYLTAAAWDAHGPLAAFQSRDQRHVHVHAIDPDTGRTTLLAEQRDDAWVTLVPGLPRRTAAGVLLTSADRDDTRTLLYGGRPVTPPGLHLMTVQAVDGETVLFTATDEPTETQLWSYDPGEGLAKLGHAGADDTRRGGTTVIAARIHGTGDEIASHAEEPMLDLRMRLLRLGERELRAALFLPSWHRPEDGPLPVLMDPYGGPAIRKALAEPFWASYVSQWFAEQGFAVLVVDGRGTPGRSPSWERAIHLDVAQPALDDQVSGLHEAAELEPALDLSRVAIRGWSYGGFLALVAILRRPDVFHAAIAGAPVTDQRMYDTHWRERHLGHPDAHPEAYDRSSPILEAAGLSRPLMLIHGLADDNVLPAHTLRFSTALLQAGRPHEVLPLAREGHRPTAEHLMACQLDFLRRAIPR
ncbi:prolyl oligopeptidase family serine peptidase [Nonomuraea typhae]|uniref:Prolyl oligopeptidase family serine peptidase n=1 Tax=Nonomuraea typhae TaxID=2603600 RepID=A0ABW7Z9W7_9ACTN